MDSKPKSAQSRSLIKTLNSFLNISYLLPLLLSIYIFVNAFQSDQRQVELHARFEQYQEIKRIEDLIQTDLEATVEALKVHTRFYDRSEVISFQRNRHERILGMNQGLMLPEDFELLKKGQTDPVAHMHLVQLDRFAWFKTKENIKQLFSDQKILTFTKPLLVRKDMPLLEHFSRLEGKVHFDDENRVPYMLPEDFETLDQLDGATDLKFDLEKFRRRIGNELIKLDLHRLTWDPINSEIELRQSWDDDRPLQKDIIKEIHHGGGRLLMGTYGYRTYTRFGIAPNLYVDLVERAIGSKLKGNENLVRFNTRTFVINTFPMDFGQEVKPERIILFPEKLALLEIDGSALMPFIISRQLKSLSSNHKIVIRLEANRTDHRYFQYPTTDMRDSSEWLKTVFQKLPDHQLSPLNLNQTPPQMGLQFITAANSKVGGTYKILVHSNAQDYFQKFWLGWLANLALLIFGIIIFFQYKNDLVHRIHRTLDECLNFVIKDPTQQTNPAAELKSASISNELDLLLEKLQVFNQMIFQKVEFFRLNQEFLKLINIPRKPFEYYMNELDYLFRDVSEKFRFSLSPDLSLNSTMSIPLKDEEIAMVKDRYRVQKDSLELNFSPEVSSLELDSLRNSFQIMIEKSLLEKGLIEADKLKSDLELSEILQSDLNPGTPPNVDGINQLIHFHRSTTMDFDCLTFHQTNQKYYVFGFENTWKGLGSAIVTTTVKAYILGLLDLGLDISATLSHINEFLTEQDLQDLFATLILLELDLDSSQLSYGGAGHPGPMLFRNSKWTALSCSDIPLGIIQGQKFHSSQLLLSDRDLVYFCNKWGHLRLQSESLKNPLSKLSESNLDARSLELLDQQFIDSSRRDAKEDRMHYLMRFDGSSDRV